MDIRHFINLIETASPQGDPQGQLALGPLLFDQRNGIGQVPDNTNIDYMGFAVLMTPSQFLRLASPRSFDDSNLDGIKEAITSGQPLGSPFLDVVMEEGETAVVKQHEGRTRMKAIQELYGEVLVLVHIFPTGMRARHVTLEMVSAFRHVAIPEKTKTPVSGPHFGVSVWLQGGWRTLP